MPTRTTRTEKLDLRLTPDAKRALQAGAAVTHRSVSEFVLESALARADEALADRRTFGLNAAQWKAFTGRPRCASASSAPPRAPPQRTRILRRRPESVNAARRIEKLRPDHAIDARRRPLRTSNPF